MTRTDMAYLPWTATTMMSSCHERPWETEEGWRELRVLVGRYSFGESIPFVRTLGSSMESSTVDLGRQAPYIPPFLTFCLGSHQDRWMLSKKYHLLSVEKVPRKKTKRCTLRITSGKVCFTHSKCKCFSSRKVHHNNTTTALPRG